MVLYAADLAEFYRRAGRRADADAAFARFRTLRPRHPVDEAVLARASAHFAAR
jgi:hypothetical protein